MCIHVECPFYCVSSDTCDYILLTGKMRGVPSDECTKYKTGFTGEDRPLSYKAKPKGFHKSIIHRLEAHYKPGITAIELAKASRLSKAWTLRWLRRVHPEDAGVKKEGWRWYGDG